jgi:HPr kinase/phosphorylase
MKSKKIFVTVQELLDGLGTEMKFKVISGFNGLNRHITAAEVNRPGLALTGYYEHFAKHRLQVLGLVEMDYLKNISSAEHYKRLAQLMQMRIPAFIIARNFIPLPETVALSNKYNVPIIRAPGVTMKVINKTSSWLEDQFSPSTKIHGVLMEVYGMGVLIMGKASVGKSECALSLVERGHILVGDDVVTVKLTEGMYATGYTNSIIGHHMEIRGIGIVNIQSLYGVKSVRTWKHIDFVVTLEEWQENKNYERLGIDNDFIDLLGIKIPNVLIPVKPGRDVALLIETAAQNEKLKKFGFNVAREFNEHLIASMNKKNCKSN